MAVPAGRGGRPTVKKFVLVITHSTDDHDRANGALALAVSLISMEADIVIFLNFQGVLLAKAGVAETIEGRNFTPARDLFPMILESEIPIYACGASATTYGLSEKDLVPGARIVNLPSLAFEMEGRETVTL